LATPQAIIERFEKQVAEIRKRMEIQLIRIAQIQQQIDVLLPKRRST
jgi:hypothetical protein